MSEFNTVHQVSDLFAWCCSHGQSFTEATTSSKSENLCFQLRYLRKHFCVSSFCRPLLGRVFLLPHKQLQTPSHSFLLLEADLTVVCVLLSLLERERERERERGEKISQIVLTSQFRAKVENEKPAFIFFHWIYF